MSMESEIALVLAKRLTGGNKGLARKLGGLTPQAIFQWKVVPIRRVLQVEKITGIPRHLIRPDMYPPDEARA